MYTVRLLKMGQCDVPGPEIYWMSHWDKWYTLNFYMTVIQGGGKTARRDHHPNREDPCHLVCHES